MSSQARSLRRRFLHGSGDITHRIANLDEFTKQTFELSLLYGRMANRYYSPEFQYRWVRFERGEPQPFGAGQDPCNAVWNPYPIGSIQTDMRGGAVVLLQDGVTGGGYACIATVIEADMDVVGQNRPNDKVKFIPVSLDMALSIRKENYIKLNRIRESYLTL